MELHRDAHLLKTVPNSRACYPRLTKEIEVKNDGIPFRLLSSVIRCFLGKMSKTLCLTYVYLLMNLI